MPRIAGSLILQVPQASGQRSSLIVTLAGQDHYLGPHGTTASRHEYDRLIGEWIAAGRPLVVIATPDLTIAELVSCHKAFATPVLRPRRPA